MPVDHSKNGFLKDIGTDWVALSANGAPLSRAATEDGVRRAVPNAGSYITGKKVSAKAEKVEAEPAPAVEPEITTVEPEPVVVEPEAEQPESQEPVTAVRAFHPETDHDGDGHPGGSLPGENSTVATGRRKRKPVA